MSKVIKLIGISMLALTINASECREKVETQAIDILSQELGVDFKEAYNNWHVSLTLEAQNADSSESYSALLNTEAGVYKMEMSVDERCDVTEVETYLF